MKRVLLALAALSVSSLVFAQASVSLFGTADVDLQYISGSDNHTWRVVSGGVGGNRQSRLGLRGREDLGEGLAASFWLEGTVNLDSGTGAQTTLNNQTVAAGGGSQGFIFNRRSTVSMIGHFGELRLGRDWTPTAANDGLYDPFWGVGVGNSVPQGYSLRNFNLARASNSIDYLLPSDLGGVYGQIMYALGETAGSKDGNLVDGRIGYAAGPVNVSVSSTKVFYTPGVTFGLTGGGSFIETSFGGSYDFGKIQLFANYASQAMQAASGPGTSKRTMKAYMLAAVVPVGASLFKFSYGDGKKTDASVAAVDGNHVKQFTLGVEYALSKRTALYANYAHVNNSGGAAYIVGNSFAGVTTRINEPSSGLDLGIRHDF